MKQRHLISILLAVVSALILASPATALIALANFRPVLMTPVTASIPRSSGALVAGVRADGLASSPTPVTFEGVHVTRGRRIDVPLQAIPIGPSLVRLVPASALRPGAYTLAGLGDPVTITVGRGPMPGMPTRPAVAEIRRVAAVHDGATAVELRARLGFAVPTGIVAVLSYWGDAAEPSVWSLAVVGQTEVVLYNAPTAHTGSSPPGFVALPDGPLSVRIAYVDQFGQRSPISEASAVE
jgi:hypothetical protein